MAENTTQSVVQQAEQADPMRKPAFWAGKALRFVVVATLIIVAIFFGWKIYQWTRPAFTIDGKNYSAKSYNDMMKAALNFNVSKTEATKIYIDIERQRAAAKKANIEVPEDLTKAFTVATGAASKNRSNPNSWQKLLGYQKALDQTLQNLKIGSKTGYALYFPFNRYIEQVYPPSSDPNFGKPSAIATDKAYAKQLADQYHAELVEGKTSPEKIAAKLKKDKKLTLGNSINPSASFYYLLNSSQNKFGKDFAAPTITAMTATGISEVLVIQSPSNIPDKSGQVGAAVDNAYLIVDLETITQPNVEIESSFKAELTKVQVHSNV